MTKNARPMNGMCSAKDLLYLMSDPAQRQTPGMFIPEAVKDNLVELNAAIQTVEEGETPSPEQWLKIREAMVNAMSSIVAQALVDDMYEKQRDVAHVKKLQEIEFQKQRLTEQMLEQMKYAEQGLFIASTRQKI